MTDNATLAKVFALAADTIEATGWCRNSYYEGERHCSSGAIIAAVKQVVPNAVAQMLDDYPWSDVPDALTIDAHRVWDDAVFVAGRALQREYGIPSLVAWNDAQRDRRKVVRFLRRRARELAAACAGAPADPGEEE
jgi:hypothetical protein